MNNEGQMSRSELQIQTALGSFLQMRGALIETNSGTEHLDEDVFTAFVEGTLSETEAAPVVSHLSSCNYCLHISAELIKLESAFVEESRPVVLSEPEPVKVGSVLNGILSRIFGTGENAVFAHEEKSEDEDADESADSDKEKE